MAREVGVDPRVRAKFCQPDIRTVAGCSWVKR